MEKRQIDEKATSKQRTQTATATVYHTLFVRMVKVQQQQRSLPS